MEPNIFLLKVIGKSTKKFKIKYLDEELSLDTNNNIILNNNNLIKSNLKNITDINISDKEVIDTDNDIDINLKDEEVIDTDIDIDNNLNDEEVIDIDINLNDEEVIDTDINLNDEEVIDTDINLNDEEVIDTDIDINLKDEEVKKNFKKESSELVNSKKYLIPYFYNIYSTKNGCSKYKLIFLSFLIYNNKLINTEEDKDLIINFSKKWDLELNQENITKNKNIFFYHTEKKWNKFPNDTNINNIYKNPYWRNFIIPILNSINTKEELITYIKTLPNNKKYFDIFNLPYKINIFKLMLNNPFIIKF